jgi:hypothetical protein
MVALTGGGAELLEGAPSLLQDRFRRELAKLEQWEQTQLLASLQRIASMMDAAKIEAAPELSPAVVPTLAEDISGYLEQAVPPAEKIPGQLRSPGLEPEEA